MAATQIAAQTYTIRDHCRTVSEIARSFQRLRDIGYQAVQASALGPIETGELRRILDDNGLVCAATHVGMDELQDTEKVLAHHAALDCSLAAIGGFFEPDPDASAWENFADTYSRIGRTLAERGLRIGYHNHSHELAPLGAPRLGAVTPLQLLVNRMDESVWFEIDTYWIAHGGGDPAAWIDLCATSGAGRVPAVHVKDMTITPQREQKMCEVGSGNLNWPAVLDVCRRVGVQWYLVERDSGDLDPFESLKISLENMQAMGLS